MIYKRSRLWQGVPPTNRVMFILCFLIYTNAYLARAGLSVGFGQLAAHYGVNDAYLGGIGTSFFAAYAAGQLINGYLGDRLEPTRFVAISMLGSAGVYTLALVLDSAVALPVLWTLNGLFLSMLWGPMLRLLCMRFGAEKKASLAMLLGAAPVGGYCLAWLAMAPRMPVLGWAAVFAVPLSVTAALLACWLPMIRAGRAGASAPGWSLKHRSFADTLRYVRERKLWRLVLTSLCLGLVKENLALLLPALFIGFLGVNVENGAWMLALSPAANLAGLLAGRLLARPLTASPAKSLALTFSGMAVLCAALAVAPGNRAVALASLFLLMALAYFGSCIQITYLPLSHVEENMISTLVGLFDFGNYLGAALAGVLLGTLMADGRRQAVAIIWLAVCLLAGLTAWRQALREKQPPEQQGAARGPLPQ